MKYRKVHSDKNFLAEELSSKNLSQCQLAQQNYNSGDDKADRRQEESAMLERTRRACKDEV